MAPQDPVESNSLRFELFGLNETYLTGCACPN